MNKFILYNGVLLQKGSNAYQLCTEHLQEKEQTKKKILKQKLDASMRQTATSYRQLHGSDLETFKIGNI